MKIKFKPTGNIFDLPEEECKRIYKEDICNYEIVDGEIEIEETVEETTVYNEIIEDNKDGETENNVINVKPLSKMTNDELKAILDARGIEYPKTAKKAELVALIEDNKDGE